MKKMDEALVQRLERFAALYALDFSSGELGATLNNPTRYIDVWPDNTVIVSEWDGFRWVEEARDTVEPDDLVRYLGRWV